MMIKETNYVTEWYSALLVTPDYVYTTHTIDL